MFYFISLKFLVLIHILILINFQTHAFENANTNKNKKSVTANNNHLCDKKLANGVRFYRTDHEGKKVKVRLRFAPFELSPTQQKNFIKFRADYEKKYGEIYGANFYQRLLCRYYFGSYEYISLPNNVTAVDELLQVCPLKTLEHLVTADDPSPDCAPGVVDCKKHYIEKPKHPLNKITCERIEK